MTRRDSLVMVLLVGALCVTTIAFGERIGVNQGQGWDGMGYTAWAQDFTGKVLHEGLQRYYSQRILPSAIVSVAVRWTGHSPTAANVIFGFQLLDALSLVGAALIWTRIALVLRWRRLTTWVGFGAVFLSFACARHALYYPTLTDSTAFFLGMLSTWGYVAGRASVLWITAAASLVTWPALAPQAFLMLLFPRARDGVPSSGNASRARWLAIGLGGLAATAYTLLSLHYYRFPLHAPGFDKFAQWIHSDLLVLTIALTAGMLGCGTYLIFADPAAWNLKHVWGDQTTRRRVLSLLGIAALLLARGWWMHRAGTRGDGPTLPEFVCQQTLEALRGPLWGPVHHVVYFGPVIVIIAMSWRSVSRAAVAWGPAATLTLALIVAFMPGSESRQWVHLLPFLVVITMTGTDGRWTRWGAVVFLLCALCWSKLWLHIGYDAPGTWFDFPTQRYFMQLGPWASDAMYVVHLCAVVATSILLYYALGASRGVSADRPSMVEEGAGT